MGRYYHGDIQGKCMFAVQPSQSADRFGSMGYTPDVIHYSFDEEHLPKINEELEKLKDAHEKVTKFFESIGKYSYSFEMLKDYGLTEQDMGDYADYNLGSQIKQCIEENGSCFFEAEL